MIPGKRFLFLITLFLVNTLTVSARPVDAFLPFNVHTVSARPVNAFPVSAPTVNARPVDALPDKTFTGTAQ